MISVSGAVKRMWLLLAIVVVAVVGGLGIYRLHSIFGVHEQPTVMVKPDFDVPLFNPKRVTYEVFGPAKTAKIVVRHGRDDAARGQRQPHGAE